MPIFTDKDKKYNVSDEHIDSFAKEYPDATTVAQGVGSKFRVRSADYKRFTEEHPSKPDYGVISKLSSDNEPIEDNTLVGNTAVDSPTLEPKLEAEQDRLLTPTESSQVVNNMEDFTNSIQQSVNDFNYAVDNQKEYGLSMPGHNLAKESDLRFDNKTGEIKKTYITPLGNRYTNKLTADNESFEYRHPANMSVARQLRTAKSSLEEIQNSINERRAKISEEEREDLKNLSPSELTYYHQARVGGGIEQHDKELRILEAARRQREEEIATLSDQIDRSNGIDVGFWRGAGSTLGDLRTWDFGISDLRDALTLMDADEIPENASKEEREAYTTLMESAYSNEQISSQYGKNADGWNRAGKMFGEMIPFMIDFAITGGASSAITGGAKAGAKASAKIIGKEAIEEIAKEGIKSYIKKDAIKGVLNIAGDKTIKAIGTTADDLAKELLKLWAKIWLR